MNNKNHWLPAVFLSVLIHIIIFFLISFAWPAVPVHKDKLTEIFITTPPASIAKSSDTVSEPIAKADSGNSIISKTTPAKATPPQQKTKKTPSPKQKQVLNVPPRYNIDFPHGNIAEKFNVFPPPAAPVKIAGKNFELPDNLSSDTAKFSVTIIYIVTANGHVKANIEKSSGNTDFDNAALRTIYTWQYKKMSADFPAPLEQIFTWPITDLKN